MSDEVNKEGADNRVLPTFENEMLEGFGLRNEHPAGQTPTDTQPTDKQRTIVRVVEPLTDFEKDSYIQECDVEIYTLPPEDEYILQDRKGVKTFPKGNLQAVIAPRKSGKSAFGSILMAGALGCGQRFEMFPATQQKMKVLYIDTEQSKSDQFKVIEYVKTYCREKHLEGEELKKRFGALHTRGLPSDILRQITERKLLLYRPDFMYIDGIKEYVNDINDPKECTEVIREFEAMSERYNCAIVLVIHTNKLKKEDLEDLDKYMTRGHIGSELENKVSDAFSCVKIEDGKGSKNYYFKAVHNISRHEEIMDVLFERDRTKEGLPIPRTYKIESNANKGNVTNKAEVLLRSIVSVFQSNESPIMCKTKFIKALSKVMGRSERTTEEALKENREEVSKILREEQKGRSVECSLIAPDQPAEPDLPFERPDDNEAEPF